MCVSKRNNNETYNLNDPYELSHNSLQLFYTLITVPNGLLINDLYLKFRYPNNMKKNFIRMNK